MDSTDTTSSAPAVLFAKPMTVRGNQVEAVDTSQLRNFFEGQSLEGRFVLQSMQGNPLEQVAERQVEVFRQAFEHLEEPLFQPHAGLNSFDFARRWVRRGFFGGHGEFQVRDLSANDRRFAAARHEWYRGTIVPKSTATMPAIPRTQIRSFHLDAPRARVFPLFTARGEREWVPCWDPLMLSGAEERGSAFQTRNHDDLVTTWIVIDYRPSEGCVSYARLAQGSNIGLVDIICTEAKGGGTDVSVAYTLTPLHAAAQALVDDFLDPRQYAHMIDGWHVATNAALAISAPLAQAAAVTFHARPE